MKQAIYILLCLFGLTSLTADAHALRGGAAQRTATTRAAPTSPEFGKPKPARLTKKSSKRYVAARLAAKGVVFAGAAAAVKLQAPEIGFAAFAVSTALEVAIERIFAKAAGVPASLGRMIAHAASNWFVGLAGAVAGAPSSGPAGGLETIGLIMAGGVTYIEHSMDGLAAPGVATAANE